MLGLGYPGGQVIEQRAKKGNHNRFKFPKPLSDRPGCDFSFSGLAEKVNELLLEEGQFWCLLPPYEMEVLNSELVKLGIVYFTKIEIKHNPIKSTFREIRQFLKTEKEVAHQNKLLIIKDLAGNYSSEFVELLKPYYLHL